MSVELLNIENELVVPGIECYSVPELKVIMDHYSKEESIEILTYFYFMFSFKSPYKNVLEKDRNEICLEKSRTLKWVEDEQLIVQASMELKNLFKTPTRRFYEDGKHALETLGKYMRTTQISDGKDGNFGTYSMNLTRMGKILSDFKLLEKAVEDEEGDSLRGGAEHSLI